MDSNINDLTDKLWKEFNPFINVKKIYDIDEMDEIIYAITDCLYINTDIITDIFLDNADKKDAKFINQKCKDLWWDMTLKKIAINLYNEKQFSSTMHIKFMNDVNVFYNTFVGKKLCSEHKQKDCKICCDKYLTSQQFKVIFVKLANKYNDEILECARKISKLIKLRKVAEKYAPDGEGYVEAKSSFETLSKEQLRN